MPVWLFRKKSLINQTADSNMPRSSWLFLLLFYLTGKRVAAGCGGSSPVCTRCHLSWLFWELRHWSFPCSRREYVTFTALTLTICKYSCMKAWPAVGLKEFGENKSMNINYQGFTPNITKHEWDLHVSGVLLSLSEPQLLGVVLALIVCLSDCQRAERGITQLTVVIFCGQDDAGRPFIQGLWTQDKAGVCDVVKGRGESTTLNVELFRWGQKENHILRSSCSLTV